MKVLLKYKQNRNSYEQNDDEKHQKCYSNIIKQIISNDKIVVITVLIYNNYCFVVNYFQFVICQTTKLESLTILYTIQNASFNILCCYNTVLFIMTEYYIIKKRDV